VANSEDDARKAAAPASGELTPGSRLAAQRAAKAAQKAAKKGTAPMVPTAVGARVSRFNELMEQNRKLILGSALALVSVLVLVTAWRLFSSTTSRSAGRALAQAVSEVSEAIRADQERLADEQEGAATEAKKPDAAKALREFRETVRRYPGTEAAGWARLGEAKELYAAGKYAEPAWAYDAAVEAADNDEFVKSRALEGLGFSLEAQKKYAEALDRFRHMAELAGGAFAPLAEYHVARMYIAQGDRQRAAVKLNEVVSSLREGSSSDAAGRNRYVMFEAGARLRELGYTPRRPRRAAGRRASTGAPGQGRAQGGSGRRTPAVTPGSEEE
jgi:tetratricopeptide (TPR) repeat protein